MRAGGQMNLTAAIYKFICDEDDSYYSWRIYDTFLSHWHGRIYNLIKGLKFKSILKLVSISNFIDAKNKSKHMDEKVILLETRRQI